MTAATVTAYVEIPREDYKRIRELSNLALTFPDAMNEWKGAVCALMAQHELTPDEFSARFNALWLAFEETLKHCNAMMEELAHILLAIQVSDPVGRKETLQ